MPSPNNLQPAHFSRQLSILAPDSASTPVLIIGAGGIGSPTAFILAKMGVSNITVYDFDTLEIENVPSQLYHPGQVGQPKVIGLQETILQFMGTEIQAKPELWTGQETAPIIISAVDSMKARKEIYDILKDKMMVDLYIEARMSAEDYRIYCLRPSDTEHQTEYEKNLYPDEQASPEECTAKAIAYNTFVIGGLIGSLVKKKLKGEPVPHEIIGDLKTMAFYHGKDI